MHRTFACQFEGHRNEEVFGVCLGICNVSYWVCPRCIIDQHGQHQQKVKTFNQIIEQIERDYTLLNKKLTQQQKIFFDQCAQFEEIHKAINSKLEFLKQCLELLKNEQYRHTDIYQLIDSLKQKPLEKKNDRIKKSVLYGKNEKFNLFSEELKQIATNLYNDGNPKEASRYFKFVIQLDQNDFNAQFSLGMCLIKLNKNKEAQESFNKAINLNSNNYASYLWKGIALRKQEHYEQANLSLQIAAKKYRNQYSRDDKEIMTQIGDKQNILGITLAKQSKEEEARSQFDQIQNLYPNYEENYIFKTKYLMKIQLFSEAFNCCNILLTRIPNSKLGYFYRGQVLSHLSRFQEAQEDFEKVIQFEKQQNYQDYNVSASKPETTFKQKQ